MKKRIVFSIITSLVCIIMLLTTVLPASSVNESDLYYYYFRDNFLFMYLEQKTSKLLEGHAGSLGLVVSNYSQTKYLAATKSVMDDATYTASSVTKGYTAYHSGYITNHVVGLEVSDVHFLKYGALHFEPKGDNVYIYLVMRESETVIKKYLNINRDKGYLELSNSKTEWKIDTKGERGFKFTDASKSKYVLNISDNGLGIIEASKATDDNYIYMHSWVLSDQNRGYVRYNYNGKHDYEAHIQSETYNMNGSMSGYDIAYWSTHSSWSSFASFWDQRNPFSKPNTVVLSGEYVKPGGSRYYSFNINGCEDYYEITQGYLYYKIVDEDGKDVAGVTNVYCPPVPEGSGEGLVRNFESGSAIATNCWACFNMPTANASGYNWEVTGVEYYTDNTYSTVNTGIDKTQYRLSIESGKRTALVSKVPANTNVYVKVTAKKTASEVPFAGPGLAYIGKGNSNADPSATSYENFGGAGVKLSGSYPMQFNDVDDPDLNSYSYKYSWKLVQDGKTTDIGTGADITYSLPKVSATKNVEIYCTVRKTNTVTKKYAEIESNHITVTLNPLTIDLFDADTGGIREKDSILIKTPKNVSCYISRDGAGDVEIKNAVTSFTSDNAPAGGVNVTYTSMYGFPYTVTEPGTYKITVRDKDDWSTVTTETVTYNYIVSENDLSISVYNKYDGSCRQDSILITSEHSVLGSAHMRYVNECYVSFN